MDPKIVFWVDHAWAQKTCQDQNFHACVVCATEPRVGGGRAIFFEISQYEQQIFNSR